MKRRNGLTKDGQRETAKKVLEDCVKYLQQEGVLNRLQKDGWSRIQQVLVGLKPVMETEPVKRAGSLYQVPHPVKDDRANTLAVRWLREGARKRTKTGLKMSEARGQEIITAYEDRFVNVNEKAQSDSVTKRNLLHREAKANRVFSHRRWR